MPVTASAAVVESPPDPVRTLCSRLAAGVDDTVLFQAGVLEASKVAWAGYRGLRRGKTLVVPGLRNKLVTTAVRFVPRSVLRKAVAMFQK